MRIIYGLLPLLMVTACASPPPPQVVVQTKLIAPSVPPDLFDCGAAPRAPAHEVMQSDVARYLVVLWAWGSECQSHLLAVRQSLATQSVPAPPVAETSQKQN